MENKPVFTFTDEDIDKAVEAFRKEHASLVPLRGRCARESDTVKVSLQCRCSLDEGGPFHRRGTPIFIFSLS